jgi:hypothetical protein
VNGYEKKGLTQGPTWHLIADVFWDLAAISSLTGPFVLILPGACHA